MKIPAAVLDDGVRFPTTTEQKSTVAHRVRRFLAAHEDGATFGDIWEAVKKGGGTKFGVRSTLQKDRAKGVVTFDGARYKLAPVKK